MVIVSAMVVSKICIDVVVDVDGRLLILGVLVSIIWVICGVIAIGAIGFVATPSGGACVICEASIIIIICLFTVMVGSIVGFATACMSCHHFIYVNSLLLN